MGKRPVWTVITAKALIIIFGLLLCSILLELGLRAAGGVFLSSQERRNRVSIRQKGAYRVLCLGESTTAAGGVYSYPSQLQEVLNQRVDGVRFSVINKGVPGMHTSDILARLEYNLDEYRPDMVITMMGINDKGPNMFFEAVSGSKIINFFRSLRIYKLTRMLWLRIKDKFNGRVLDKPDSDTADLAAAGKGIPKNDWSDVGLGRPCQDQGQLFESEALFKKAVGLNPKNDRAYFALGWIYRSEGRRAEAEAAFRKAIALNPANYWPYVEQGGFSRSEEVFKKAIVRDPRDGWAYIGLGWLYRDQGKLSAAEAAFKKAIKADSRSVMAYIELGWILRDQGELSGAEAAFRKAMELDPKNNNPCFELGWIYEHQARYLEAEALFNKVIGANPKNFWPYVEIGRFYLERDKLPEAEAAFNKAVELDPRNSWPYVGLGQTYRKRDRSAEAEAAFRKAIELDPQNDRAYSELGAVYEKQGRYAAAEDVFNKAIEANPRQGWPYLELGLICQAQGKRLEAEPLFKKAIELDPGNDRAYRTLKLLYVEMGDQPRGREYDNKANQLTADYYPRIVIDNYRKLKAALDKRGIVYVCAQYPLRNIAPLEKIFQDSSDGIIFADNQGIFQEALKKKGYNKYFTDKFGGDFGHCTPAGNRLLAENIADAILDELWEKDR